MHSRRRLCGDVELFGGFAAACDKQPSIFPDAADYTADGPHPTAVLVSDRLNGTSIATLSPAGATNGPAWAEEDTTKVQAVACVERLCSDSAAAVTQCRYLGNGTGLSGGGPEYPLEAGEYDVTMVGARDGRELLHIRLTGENKDCPGPIPQGTYAIYTAPTDAQLKSSLGAMIDGG